MKTWLVKYRHRKVLDQFASYAVVAEDDELAGQVGFESLEEDEHNFDPVARCWTIVSVTLIETCHGCGGYRHVSAPPGSGAILL